MNNTNILESIKAYSFSKNKENIFNIKSGIVWGHSNKNNSIFPILYISKPKNISKEDFDLLLEKIDIQFKK